MKRPPVAAWLIALLLVLGFTPARAGGEVVYPSIAATTVLHVTGSSGITLAVPTQTRIGQYLSLSHVDASYVRVVFEYQDGPIPGLCSFCPLAGISFIPNKSEEPSTGTCLDDDGNDIGCPLHPGLVNVYMVTDGAFTLTVEFPNLTGQTELNATGRVHAILERLPMTCPTGDCDKLAYGGVAHEIGLRRPGMQVTVGYFRVPSYIPGTGTPPGGGEIPNMTVNNIDVCTYPGLFHPQFSPNPEHHPLGCDAIISKRSDTNPAGMNNTIICAPCVGMSCPGCTSVGTFDLSYDAQGLVYAGIRMAKAQAGPEGPPEAWGAWLDPGIDCPSGDFNNCQQQA